MPGLDLDLYTGEVFKNDDQFAATKASVASYWRGFGLSGEFARAEL
jgi:hypothetical protein